MDKLLAGKADVNCHVEGQSPLPWMPLDGSPDAADVMKRMLDLGMDVNGTATIWPDNKTEVAGCTALMTAAWRGKPPLVRLLLSYGVDIHRRDSTGRTALDWARAGKSKNHQKVVVLLEKAGATAGSGAEIGRVEIPDFKKPAKSEGFKQVLAELQRLTGSKPQKIELEDDMVVGGKAFPADEDRAREIVAEHLDDFRERGALIFVARDVTYTGGTSVVALPTTDFLEAVAAIQTNGINSKVTNYDILNFLKQLSADQPFLLTEIYPDLIRGRFLTPIRNPRGILESLIRLCPDYDLDGTPSDEYVDKWAARGELFLWWD